MKSLNERDHARRAQGLYRVFSHPIVPPSGVEPLSNGRHAVGKRFAAAVENLAEFLHQQYRATAKAMAKMHGQAWNKHDGTVVYKEGPVLHDHGFGDCYGKKKEYFRRRAAWLLTDFPAGNGRLRKK